MCPPEVEWWDGACVCLPAGCLHVCMCEVDSGTSRRHEALARARVRSRARSFMCLRERERESKVVLVLPRSTARAESARKDSRGVAYCSGARLFRAKGARGAFGRESRQLKRIFFSSVHSFGLAVRACE